MRWHMLYKDTLLTQQYCRGEVLIELLLDMVKASAAIYCKRLMRISWFIGHLNELFFISLFFSVFI